MLGKMMINSDNLTEYMLQKMLNHLDRFSSTISNLCGISNNSDSNSEKGEDDQDVDVDEEKLLVFKD